MAPPDARAHIAAFSTPRARARAEQKVRVRGRGRPSSGSRWPPAAAVVSRLTSRRSSRAREPLRIRLPRSGAAARRALAPAKLLPQRRRSLLGAATCRLWWCSERADACAFCGGIAECPLASPRAHAVPVGSRLLQRLWLLEGAVRRARGDSWWQFSAPYRGHSGCRARLRWRSGSSLERIWQLHSHFPM